MGKKAVLPGFFKAFNLSQARKGVNPQGSEGAFPGAGKGVFRGVQGRLGGKTDAVGFNDLILIVS
jgi:hypothetical protein